MNADPLLIEQARSADPDARQKAAYLVAHMVDERDYPLMFELLGDKDWRVRKTIVDGFVRDPQPEVVAGLLDSLADAENAGKRNSATEALIRIGEDAIIPIVDRLRIEHDVDVRLSLVNLLGDLRSSDAFDILVETLEGEPDINVSSSIVSSLGKYRDAAALPHLMRVLQREDLWLKFHAIEALGEIGDRAALPAILPLYKEKSLRKPVLEAVGKIADVGTVSFLLRIIATDEKLNLTALRALVRIAETSKPKIVEHTERLLIQRKFRESFPESKIDPLIEHLHATPKRDVKTFILKFLGWSGDERALPVLSKIRRLLQNPSTPMKLNSLSVFVNIQGEGYHDELLLASKDSDPVIRQKAVSLMGMFSEERFADALVLSLADEATSVRLAAINAIVRHRPAQGLDPLISSLEDSDIWIRTAAAQALGEYRNPAAIEPLVHHLDHDLPPVRIAAIEALGKSGDERAKSVLFDCAHESDLEVRRAAILSLGRVPGEEVFDYLMFATTDVDWRIRAAAVTAVAVRGDRTALPALYAALQDPDTYVQQSAVLALDKLPDRASFPYLFRALENSAILDEVSDLFVRHKQLYRDLLEEAWRTADSRREVVIAAILQAMKEK